MFRPYMWAIIRLWLDLYLRPGTMVPSDIMRSRTRHITPQDHYTHASIA